MDRFRRPGLQERFTQLAYLLKHTVTIVGRDADIIRPLVRMAIYAAVLVTVFFAMIWAYAVDSDGTGTLLLLLAVILFIYKFFYYNRQELAVSWLVAETAFGRDRSVTDAAAHVATLRGQARILALLDMGAAWIASRKNNNKSGLLTNLLLSAITEGWDLVNHFLLPAFAIDNVGFRDAMGKIRAARDNVPETLMGVFGIDILGRVVVTIFAPIYTLLALAGVALGTWLAGVFPQAFHAGQFGDMLPPEALEWLPISATSEFNWLPLLVAIFLGKVVAAVFERAVTTLKVIYFTLFYARTLHAGSLSEDIRGELERYLRLEGEDAESPDDGVTAPG
ncbi:hypothetical protein C2I36_03070 [Rhodobacteraceae bacterium WD3A24]|nr:hypothetical protein C2I36_03070 [Rhodobacteraceae bacterium WD3A24]